MHGFRVFTSCDFKNGAVVLLVVTDVGGEYGFWGVFGIRVEGAFEEGDGAGVCFAGWFGEDPYFFGF